MYGMRLSFVLWLGLVTLSACVSQSKYLELEQNFTDSQKRLQHTEIKLKYTEKSREECLDNQVTEIFANQKTVNK